MDGKEPPRSQHRAQCEAPRPLPILRSPDELPVSLEIPPERPSYLEEVAKPENSREDLYVDDHNARTRLLVSDGFAH